MNDGKGYFRREFARFKHVEQLRYSIVDNLVMVLFHKKSSFRMVKVQNKGIGGLAGGPREDDMIITSFRF